MGGRSPGRRDAVLVVDETADEKSSADCAGAARQYSGTAGGVALCQVAVTLTFATSRGHALIGRALYLPEGCAADEEHRELAGVPEEVLFATKPQLAGALLDRAHALGIRAAFVAGDEVYGGRELRRSIRQRGMGYVMAVRANHTVTAGSGRTLTAAAAAGLILVRAWHRMRTGSGTKGTRHYDWAMLEVTSDDTPEGHGGSCATSSSRRPGETGPTGCTGRNGAAATSTVPAKPTSAGMLMQRQRHGHKRTTAAVITPTMRHISIVSLSLARWHIIACSARPLQLRGSPGCFIDMRGDTGRPVPPEDPSMSASRPPGAAARQAASAMPRPGRSTADGVRRRR